MDLSHSPTTTSSPFHLRDATLCDMAGIVEIEHLGFENEAERFGMKRVGYLIRSPRTMVTVAESDGHLLGWVAGHAWVRTQTPWGRIYALAIHPKARGRRLGPLLLHHMLDSLTRRGAGQMFLEVRPDNQSAIKLYEKSGFRVCRTIENYYGEGSPAHRMTLAT